MTFEENTTPGAIRLASGLAMPEKAALSTTTTVVSVVPPDASPCASVASTPRSDKTTNPFETDVEALAINNSIDKPCRKSLTLDAKTDCQVWPGKDHWKKQAKEAKMKRSCSCMARLSRRNRIIAKILLILLVVGIAVGVGFGVSKPLGAPIWGKSPGGS